MLDGKEMAEFKRLQGKMLEASKPLVEADLIDMEDRVKQVYNKSPAAFKGFCEGWNEFCSLLHIIANDNAKLIGEVRNLRAPKAVDAIAVTSDGKIIADKKKTA